MGSPGHLQSSVHCHQTIQEEQTVVATEIHGTCDESFAPVRDAFAKNFEEEGEVGAACAVYLGGDKVVDLWGGMADREAETRWQENTICGFYSTGKPFAALGLLRCIDAGLIALDAPVASVWEAFAQGNKGEITFRQVLSHRAGLPAIRKRMPEGAMLDWNLIVDELAAQEPWWEPDSRHVYHSNTYGFLVGEPVRCLTGLSPGRYIAQHVSGPLGIDLFFGVPDEALDRTATLYWESYWSRDGSAPDPSVLDRPMSDEEKMLQYATLNPTGFSGLGVMNSRSWRQAEVPSTNGHGSARAVARVYSTLAMGGEDADIYLLSPEMLGESTRVQSEGYCPALDREVSFGLGFQITRPDRRLGPNPRSFGHFGTGGSLGFADPDAGIGFGYVMNRIKPRWQSPSNRALMEAVYASL
jgi:CubicO group peptidase (beta-lactamase class C family)